METTRKRPRWIWIVAGIALLCPAPWLPRWVATLRATQGAVATYSQLIVAANRQDLIAIRLLCTEHYLKTHAIQPAKEGGVIGLPRNIDKNFQAWRDGEVVYLCPTNRVGPVYRFLDELGAWKFDGPAGVLRSRGEFLRSEAADFEGDSGTDAP